MLEARPYLKIEYLGMDSKMLILPGDRVGINFGSKASPYEAFRMQPDIHSATLPEPFRTRYTGRDGQRRLPCDDVMIADSMTCRDTVIYCSSAEEEFQFSVSGSGEIFSFIKRSGDFVP
jgi:hypothetical protein